MYDRQTDPSIYMYTCVAEKEEDEAMTKRVRRRWMPEREGVVDAEAEEDA